MNQFEIEIKTLLGSKENADKLIAAMQSDPSFKQLGSHKQLNHYFTAGNLKLLYSNIKSHIDPKLQKQFDKIASLVSNYSVRTRQTEITTIFVLKVSEDETTSANGIGRMEFEAKVDLTLDQLDQLLLKSDFQYLSKWSRERQEFEYKGINVTVDKNAGYGYLAEFEKIAKDRSEIESMKIEIKNVMKQLGAEELPQDRLARMFDYYNAHWPEYYGTDKVFNVE